MRSGRGLAAALLLLAAGCGGEQEAAKAANRSCAGLLQAADATAALPSEYPTGVQGAVFYELQAQGATKRYFAYAPGADMVRARDAVRSAFESAGFTILGTDEEAGAEAEFEWSGKGTEGTVQVIPLCKEHLRIRWRVSPK